MSTLRERIPTKQVLYDRLDDTFQNEEVAIEVKKSAELRSRTKQKKYISGLAIVSLSILMAVFYFLDSAPEHLVRPVQELLFGWVNGLSTVSMAVVLPIFLILMLLVSLGLMKLIIAPKKLQRALSQRLNVALERTINKTLGLNISFGTDESHQQKSTQEMLQGTWLNDLKKLGACNSGAAQKLNKPEVAEELEATGLITETVHTSKIDNTFTVTTQDEVTIDIREVQATKQISTGKFTRKVIVFKGVFVSLPLNKTLTGRTFISTEGDKSGFAHKDFWSNLFQKNQVQETILESNAFERDLHVATDNPAEARYVLTTNFMVDLHDWWQEHQSNIRIVFKEDKMYMLLPDEHIKLGESTTSSDPEAIKDYAMTILTPIWRTLLLAEDVRL